MKHLMQALLAAALIAGVPAIAQRMRLKFGSIPSPTLYSFPPDSISAKWAVWRRIRTAIFSSTRGPAIPRSRSAPRVPSPMAARGCSSSIRNGKFVREIGKDSYGFMFAAQVRIDPSDNIWVVDQMTNMVIKFDPQGRLAYAARAKSRESLTFRRVRRRETAQDSRPTCSTVRPTSPGTRPGTYSSPTAWAMRASPSSIKTANS